MFHPTLWDTLQTYPVTQTVLVCIHEVSIVKAQI